MSMGVRFYILKPVKYEELVQTFTTIRMELDHKYQISEDFPGDSEQDRFVANVRAYVDGNLKSASLKGLANQLYMNSCYVSQLYKEKTGQNFSDYLLEARMKKAAELLVQSSEKIYTIGTMVGYSNAKNFARSFLAYYGKTPTEYRNIHKISITSSEGTND